MAERPRGYGLTAEISGKIDSKFNSDLAKEAGDWVISYVRDGTVVDWTVAENIQSAWKDGVDLCKLINALEPGSVKKINTSKMAFKQMENIGNFLDAIGSYGVAKTDSFQTVDLYEGQNIPQVVNAIHALGRKAGSKGKHGIGPKESGANKRQFTEEQLRAGEGVIGLQMGSNKGATQSGQNFGKTRAILD